MTHKFPYYNPTINYSKYNYYPYYNRKKNLPKNEYLNNNPNCTSKNNMQNLMPAPCDESSKHEKKSNVIFEIFGIKLYYDDILLLSLILFLYKEGVKDQYLFISLILLLLS